MNKIAQRRSMLNKLRETVNAPSEAISGAFSPEFARLMDTLRSVDDDAREQASDLKDLLKVARSNFNRREYMATITYLGKFHEKLESIKSTLNKLNKEVDNSHNEFLFGDLDPEHKEYLFNKMPARFQKKVPAVAPVAKADDGLDKSAGMKDWWHNLTSDRGKAMKLWEKRYPKAVKELKRQTEKMLNRSEMFLNILLANFKMLASHRATRKLEDYIKVSEALISKYNAYDSSFNEYFNGTAKKYIDNQREFEANQKLKEEESAGAVVNDEGIVPDEKDSEPGKPGAVSVKKPDSEAEVITQDFYPASKTKNDMPAEKTIEEEIAEMEGKQNPRPFPKPEQNPLAKSVHPQSYMEVSPEELISSDPSLPFPLNNHKAPVPERMLPAIEDDAVITPTMRSPIMPSAPTSPPGDVYQQSIPKSPPVPRLSDLERPLTPEQENKFYMYQPEVEGPATVRSGPVKPVSEPIPATERKSPETVSYPLPSQAQVFYEKLTKMSGENPIVIAKEVIKFAKSIETTDPATSTRLLAVAKNLLK